MNISMPRGDLRKIKFSITDNKGEILDTDFDEIYITFKESFEESEYLFQKKLSDNSITKDAENYYHFEIEPEDTNELKYGNYVFDIEIIKEETIKQTTVGNFILTSEVTFYENEGN